MTAPEKLNPKAWAQVRLNGRMAPSPLADRWAKEVVAEAKADKAKS